MNIEQMKNAYGILFEIENLLREFIRSTMAKEYGVGWMIAAPAKEKYPPYKRRFEEFYLHELIRIASSYKCLSSPLKPTMKNLQNIISVRNKIAHSKLITQEEYIFLINTLNEMKDVTQYRTAIAWHKAHI